MQLALNEDPRQEVRFRVPVPFLHQEIGSGDVVQQVTQAIGIHPCRPCEERKEQMNKWLGFRPWDT